MAKVYLVGAGCGNLDLYTQKAIQCLTMADCVVYDSLVDQAILDLCKDGCQKIYVGKRAGNHALKQDEINQLLVDLTLQFETIVRLKGGDVYVFGRGGEEGMTLTKAGIDFEVVPGVSSVTGGLAYAGIPITHRGLSSGFQVYTARLANQSAPLDFHHMLCDDYTYVFLMGMAELHDIVSGFLSAGKNPATPIAVVSHASLPRQQTLVGTLADICEKAAKASLPTPGLIVVGAVVQMRPYLNFFEQKPLFGKRVLITTVGKDHTLYEKIRELGAEADEVMTGEIHYLPCDLPSELIGDLIFTSRHGVEGFMRQFFKQYHDVRALHQTRLICIGEKTNQALRSYGLIADVLPEKADSDDLNRLLNAEIKGKRYVFKGQMAEAVSGDENIVVYENRSTNLPSQPELYDFGLFTCASSVRRFKEANASSIRVFVSIGAHTSRAIRMCYGEEAVIIEAVKASKEALVEALLGGMKNVL